MFIRREGFNLNNKRLFRIHHEEGLHVRRRGGRKRAMGTRPPMVLPLLPNQRSSLDFVSDQLTDGRRFQIMTVVDNCTRDYLALNANTSLSGARVARELAMLFDARGKSQTIVSDRRMSENDLRDRFPEEADRATPRCPNTQNSNPESRSRRIKVGGNVNRSVRKIRVSKLRE